MALTTVRDLLLDGLVAGRWRVGRGPGALYIGLRTRNTLVRALD
jgi:hypothetical protein